MPTTAVTKVVDACVLGLKSGVNWARMYTSGRIKSKEGSCNTMTRQRTTKT